MGKYALLLGVSLCTAAFSAQALTAEQQLEAVKDVFVNDFHNMDDDGDGKLSLDEYLSHQFENFRANILEADGFERTGKAAAGFREPVKKEVKKMPWRDEKPRKEKKKEAKDDALKNLGAASSTLQEMADFDLDFDFDNGPLFDDEFSGGKKSGKLTKEDVMPEIEAEDDGLDIDLSMTEEETLKSMLNGHDVPLKKEVSPEEKKTALEAAAKKEKQIAFMMETIKKTLPKKVDEITTWTGIEYQNKEIVYIYQADVDTTPFSKQEKQALTGSIESEACTKAYEEMCPKIKPMFINDGTNMRIRYIDKAGTEIGFCEFNDTTCE